MTGNMLVIELSSHSDKDRFEPHLKSRENQATLPDTHLRLPYFLFMQRLL